MPVFPLQNMAFGELPKTTSTAHPLIHRRTYLPQIEYTQLLIALPYVREGLKKKRSGRNMAFINLEGP